jgi:hypothetical protein
MSRDSCDTLVEEEIIRRREALIIDGGSALIGGMIASSLTLISTGLMDIIIVHSNWTTEGKIKRPNIEVYSSSRMMAVGYLSIGGLLLFTCVPLFLGSKWRAPRQSRF